MNSNSKVGSRARLLAAAGMMVFAGTAGAQEVQYPPGAVVQPLPAVSGSQLRDQLSTLADNPESASALVGAGRAALAAGDTQAAIVFFGRAEEIAPRDARAKAGIAEALVRLGQAEGALRYYDQAVRLGAPEDEIAKERGLAHDMAGDPRRAQQDYARVLRRGSDAEVERRLALSLAISGNREAALGAIDDQLRRQDRAAWRTRAFVLALTGDWQEARQTAAAVMPADQADALAPFLGRLAALNPQQKAMAVHFGQFPSDGQPVRMARQTDTSAYPGAVALAGGGQNGAVPAAAQPAPARQAQAAEERVGPGSRTRTSRSARRETSRQPARAPTPVRTAEAASPPPQPVQQAPAPQQLAPVQQAPVRSAEAAPVPQTQPSPQTQVPSQVAQRPAGAVPAAAGGAALRQPSITGAVDGSAQAASLSSAPPSSASPAPAVRETALPPSAGAPIRTETPSPSFADIASAIAALPSEPRSAPATSRPTPAPNPPAANPPRQQASRAATPPAAARTAPAQARPAAPAHPSRHWVQVAGGADKATLPREFARLKARAPDQLGDRTAWTTPLRFTNRLLVGPFESSRAAQEFVNGLARAEISAFSWTSPEGQEIERLPDR